MIAQYVKGEYNRSRNMMEVLFLFSGLILTAVLIPIVRKISPNIDYLDRPEGDALKIHPMAIPHSGGIAIFAVFALIFGIFSLGAGRMGSETGGLLLGGSLAWALGIWADLKPASPVMRLGIQILCGMILVFFGHRIEAPLFISLPLTLFYVVGAINAMNMEDGLDGLAGGTALLSCAGFSFLSSETGRTADLMASFVLIGVLVGFLVYNFNPASIFMGDCGSYFLGFILAYLAVGFTSLESWQRFLGPILIIGMPVFDTAYAIVRRVKNGVSPFYGDRSHFYDQLMQKGLSVRQTVLICWGIQAAFVTFGVFLFLIGRF